MEVDEGNGSQVLNASVHDIRYFAALLRGVNLGNRASVTMTKDGFIINVEEARTMLATAYIFADVFDEYIYNSETAAAAVLASQSQGSNPEDGSSTAFEIPLNLMCECINVFGTAGTASTNLNPAKKPHRWRRVGQDGGSGDEQEDRRRGNTGSGSANPQGSGRIDNYFKSEKGTGLRISYAGAGYPLTLLISDEHNGGPSATCEITTFDPEPQFELPFGADDTVMKIILKSSWLRDALTELDPSYEKLTIIGNPPPPQARAPRANAPPRLRIQAEGPYGSTEMDYPSDKEVLETCECPEPVKFSYRFAHIVKALSALQTSTKTSLRINEDGLLSLQFLMPPVRPGRGGGGEAFIEYRCLALDDSVE